jgi:hypothetical protein
MPVVIATAPAIGTVGKDEWRESGTSRRVQRRKSWMWEWWGWENWWALLRTIADHEVGAVAIV